MGNSIIGAAGRNKAKVMKISGETLKLKTPILVVDVIKDYPGHVLLESEMVKRFGIRAKPLEAEEELKAKKIYFLVELPKLPTRATSSAKERLECLMLSRRSGSDLLPAVSRQSSTAQQVKVKMRLPKAQLEKLIQETKDETELAQRILHLCAKDSFGSENPSSELNRPGF